MNLDLEPVLQAALNRGLETEKSIRTALSSKTLEFYANAGFHSDSLKHFYLSCKNATHFGRVVKFFELRDSWHFFSGKIDLMGGSLSEWLECVSILEFESSLSEKTLETIVGYISCCQEYKNTHGLELPLPNILNRFLKKP